MQVPRAALPRLAHPTDPSSLTASTRRPPIHKAVRCVLYQGAAKKPRGDTFLTIMKDAKIALVTGGAIRVGAAMVKSLAQAGYRVWIHACSSRKPAQALAQELGEMALGPVFADLGQEEQREALVQTILDPAGPAQGQLSLLVNNAASFEQGPWSTRKDQDLRRVLELNLVAPLSLARSLAPALREQSNASIINIVDLGAIHPSTQYFEHSISKCALAHATRCLALELAPQIRCNAIAPGTVLLPPGPQYAPGSELEQALVAATPQGRLGCPDDIAHTLRYLAENQHINGQCLAVDGGRSLGQGLL